MESDTLPAVPPVVAIDSDYRNDIDNNPNPGWHFITLGEDIWKTCEEKGFHDAMPIPMLERGMRLMLIVSELGEALEDLRQDDMVHHEEEIADVMIRLLHYAACEGIDLDAAVAKKMAKNRDRPHKHGKAF